jgi:CheY-like chemotaxis protein
MPLHRESDAVMEEAHSLCTEAAVADYVPFDEMRRANPAKPIPRPKVLLVDDDDTDIFLTRKSLEKQNCEVVSARSVNEAFQQIASQSFDVLLTDLHMPEAGDGFSVVTVMRHCQPEALTLVASDFPDVQKAINAIVLQADAVLTKPFDVKQLPGLLDKKHLPSKPAPRPVKEAVATILERDVHNLMQRWLVRVEQVKELAALPLSPDERTAYLPEIVKSIDARLRIFRTVEVIDRPSPAAVAHGQVRYRQGYTAPLIVQESRLLQVSIFETIERNLATVDFTSVLPDIMVIADEVDSQLKQTIESFLTMQREQGAASA